MLKIKNVLISQPAPADYDKSPYKQLASKFGLKIVFRKFIKVEGVTATEFRKNKINLLDYTAIIFTSRNAVDHFFRMAKEMRVIIPITMKYFCSSETTAFYLQNYIQYRKRKIFYGKQTLSDLIQLIGRHKDETYLWPCSEESGSELPNALAKVKVRYAKAPLFRTVPEKIASEINVNDFDFRSNFFGTLPAWLSDSEEEVLSRLFFFVVAAFTCRWGLMHGLSRLFKENAFGSLVVRLDIGYLFFWVMWAFPVLLVSFRLSNCLSLVLLGLGTLYVLVFLFKWFKVLALSRQLSRFSYLHIFLYLCALEILPFLCFYKLIGIVIA